MVLTGVGIGLLEGVGADGGGAVCDRKKGLLPLPPAAAVTTAGATLAPLVMSLLKGLVFDLSPAMFLEAGLLIVEEAGSCGAGATTSATGGGVGDFKVGGIGGTGEGVADAVDFALLKAVLLAL